MKYRSGQDIIRAASTLQKGGLVAIPTETVYGLAANAFDESSVLKVFEAKKRPAFDPLIVHCAGMDMVREVSREFPPELKVLTDRFWPGPLTVVVPKSTRVPDLVTSGMDTVGIRIPNHPLTLELLRAIPFPVAAPSANPFTYVSPTSAAHVAAQLGEQVDYILDGGNSKVGIESTIIRYRNEQIEVLRLGGLSIEALQELSNIPVVVVTGKDNTAVPGNFKKHYSNNKPLILHQSLAEVQAKQNEALLYFSKAHCTAPTDRCWFLSENGSMSEAASNLFRILRELDQPEIEVIHAELAPNHGLGPAINDRLKRASSR